MHYSRALRAWGGEGSAVAAVRVLQQLVRRPGPESAGSAAAWNDLGDSLGDALQFNDAIQGVAYALISVHHCSDLLNLRRSLQQGAAVEARLCFRAVQPLTLPAASLRLGRHRHLAAALERNPSSNGHSSSVA
jgi:hypothetical protein